MEELWALKSILDVADDVAIMIVGERDEKVLYCNYLATLKTGMHEGSNFADIWHDAHSHISKCGDGRTYRFFTSESPFGHNKNVTISKIVWNKGIKAYAILVTSHVENKEERDREIIFKTLGQSYLCVQTFDLDANLVYTIFAATSQNNWFYKPLNLKEWQNYFINSYIAEDDRAEIADYISITSHNLVQKLQDNNNVFSFQFRRIMENGDRRWTQARISLFEDSETKNKRIVCTQRDIHDELVINRNKVKNEMIMKSLTNIYRSVYLLDLITGEYSTVKPDELLFGIPGSGQFEDLLKIVCELIPDKKQKKDLLEYFSVAAIKQAFDDKFENIGREYKSSLSADASWMSISAFKTPPGKELDNKCVITFTDVTEHKRVELERDENSLAIQVLSQRYLAVFILNQQDYSYHAIRIPNSYKYLEKQYKNMKEAFSHYLAAYVLEEYREILKKNATLMKFFEGTCEDGIDQQEYIYKNVDNKWIRLSIIKVPSDNSEYEYILAFEDYTVTMQHRSLSSIYSKIMLADYEKMYEYDPYEDKFAELLYDGEKLIRDNSDNYVELGCYLKDNIHPDDFPIFKAACDNSIVEENVKSGKTVTHLCIRRLKDGVYHSYMYGFHYFKEFSKKYVLIMERDADHELM